MNAVYVEDVEETLKYFVFGLKQDGDECEEYHFKGIKTIAERAFCSPWNVKRVFFDESLTTIKKEAFKECSELEVFCCGNKLSEDSRNEDGQGNFKLNELMCSLKVTESQESEGQNADAKQKSENISTEFTVQASAFANCENLHTIVFPKCNTLKIEKKAFSGCESLRTVVAFSENIDFTENPFEGCPRELVFVCSKDSAVERFARENGYRSVYVQ